MWLRLRLDIGWRDFGHGLVGALIPGGRRAAQVRLEEFWSDGRRDAFACLSVRSGFDLLLRALELPAGSEVLFSAITIADMPRIAQGHGLVPVPVDVLGSDCHLDLASLRKSLTSRSRVLVVAHLFGARPELGAVLAIAREHNLIVVEDCAQAWCGQHWRGHHEADASLFSFGAIKTATSLGSALCRVKDPQLLARMRALQSQDPVEGAAALPLKCCKFTLLKALSTKFAFGVFAAIGRAFGFSVDALIGNLTRGFSAREFFAQLRQQPSAGSIRLLHHRLRTYDPQRIQQRVQNAQRIIAELSLEAAQPELLDSRHTFWLFPFASDYADALIPYLREHGFDTTQRGRLEVLSPPEDRPLLVCPQATRLLEHVMFLPCYPELTTPAIDRMCGLIREFMAADRDPEHSSNDRGRRLRV